MINALFRALLVAALIAFPALTLSGNGADGTQMVTLIAIIAGLLIFMEYNSAYPSFVEFRYAAPINRLRFGALCIAVAVLTAVCADASGTTTLGAILASLARLISGWLDVPFSPVRLLLLVLPADAPDLLVTKLRNGAGFAYLTSVVMLAVFAVMIRLRCWPTRTGVFNVWVNLPLFDPTAGHDVVRRLQAYARINLALGFLLPFLVPAAMRAGAEAGYFDPLMLERPQTLVWVVSLWAILPASIMIRGLAMGRVAEMIQQKRERAYAAAEAEGVPLA